MAKITKVGVGEALVGEGNEVAHIDLVIGPRGSAAEDAFCNSLSNNKDGFTTLLAVIAPNLQCRPNTVILNKVTIKGARQAVQMFGPAQYAVARAIQDSVADGIIPANEAEDLYVCVSVFIHWDASDDAKIQDFNYEATREALLRAIKGRPTAAEVLELVNSASHPFAASAAAPSSAPPQPAPAPEPPKPAAPAAAAPEAKPAPLKPSVSATLSGQPEGPSPAPVPAAKPVAPVEAPTREEKTYQRPSVAATQAAPSASPPPPQPAPAAAAAAAASSVAEQKPVPAAQPSVGGTIAPTATGSTPKPPVVDDRAMLAAREAAEREAMRSAPAPARPAAAAPPPPVSAPAPAAPPLPTQLVAEPKRKTAPQFAGGAPSADIAISPGRLVHRIPSAMTVGDTQRLEVRIGAKDIAGLADDVRGAGALTSHDIGIVETMTVTLHAPGQTFEIVPRTEATQLVQPSSTVVSAFKTNPFACWEWDVTPLEAGQHDLVVKVSAAIRDSRDLATTVALKDQNFPVSVSVNLGRSSRKFIFKALGWLTLTVLAALVSIYSQEVWWPIIKPYFDTYMH